jgi:CTP synthase
MLGSQFHPELKSRPNRPHPLFRDFLAAAAELAGEQLPLEEAAVRELAAD